jgi:hypothetical protein
MSQSKRGEHRTPVQNIVRPRRAKLPPSPLEATCTQHHWIMSGLIDRQGRDVDLTSGLVIDSEILELLFWFGLK